jgi:hypothetical protein
VNATFVVNVVKRRTVHIRRTLHRPECRWAAAGSRRRTRTRLRAGSGSLNYTISLVEAVRLLDRAEKGDDDGRTVSCAYCEPARLARLLTETT